MNKLEYSPRYLYRINRVECNYTRGVFNEAKTGRFVSYERDAKNPEVKMRACEACWSGSFWVDWESLEIAGGWIECEYCGHKIEPQNGNWK